MSDTYDGDEEWGDPGMHKPYGWSQADVDRWIEINQIAGQNWQTESKAAEAQGFDLRGGDPRAVQARQRMTAQHQALVDKNFTAAHIKALDDNVEHGYQLDLQSARTAQRRGEPMRDWQKSILAHADRRAMLDGPQVETPAKQKQDPAMAQARQQAAAKKAPAPKYKYTTRVNVIGGPAAKKVTTETSEADSAYMALDLPEESGSATTASEMRQMAAKRKLRSEVAK